MNARAAVASSAPRMRVAKRMPSSWSGGAGARSSARRHIKRITQADRLTSWTGRKESGATGRESQACRRQHIPSMPPKEAATNESEGVAGLADRMPRTPAAGRALERAYASSGRGRRPLRKNKNKEGKWILTPATYHYVTGRPAFINIWFMVWFMPGHPGHVVLFSSIYGSVRR